MLDSYVNSYIIPSMCHIMHYNRDGSTWKRTGRAPTFLIGGHVTFCLVTKHKHNYTTITPV